MGAEDEQHPSQSGGDRPGGNHIWGGCGMSVLEDFWYGNIEPSEYDTSSAKGYKEALLRISRNEESLQDTLTDAQRKLFAQYLDSVREFQDMAECLLFQNSFRLGARMILEIMNE